MSLPEARRFLAMTFYAHHEVVPVLRLARRLCFAQDTAWRDGVMPHLIAGQLNEPHPVNLFYLDYTTSCR